jgi:hypothetical protein
MDVASRWCGKSESWADGFLDAIDGVYNIRPSKMPDDLTQEEQADFDEGFASACELRASFEYSQTTLLAAWLRRALSKPKAAMPSTARLRRREMRHAVAA